MECASSWNREGKRKQWPPQTAGKLPLLISFLLACRQWTEFGARLHHAEDGIARDDANDLGRAVAGAAHDGHLIDIRAQEPLEQTEERLLRRCPEYFFARNHGGLHGVMCPPVAGEGVGGVNVHHADEAVAGKEPIGGAAPTGPLRRTFLQPLLALGLWALAVAAG